MYVIIPFIYVEFFRDSEFNGEDYIGFVGLLWLIHEVFYSSKEFEKIYQCQISVASLHHLHESLKSPQIDQA